MALSLESRLVLARQALGKSVVAVNPRAEAEAKRKTLPFYCMGIKDSADIPADLLKRVKLSTRWLVLTIDHMSDLGRSVDTELINPLTYRPMTGSTSGGAINVLKGINDACVGTDGGGSVLAPALATNMYAFMGKGAGLTCNTISSSTDGMSFVGGVGFIARTFDICITAAQDAGDISLDGGSLPERIIVPARGCAKLPDGRDMGEYLRSYAERCGLYAEEYAFADIYDRRSTVCELLDLWKVDSRACVASFEGPIDVLGADETIPRGFQGYATGVVSGIRSKALSKAVNIAGGSAMCIPSDELACGFVICCGEGIEAACDMVCVAKKLDDEIELPECLVRYFHERTKAPQPLIRDGLFETT